MQEPVLHADFETASACDLRSAGVYRYVEHPTTRIWLLGWRIGDEGPIERWYPGQAAPARLIQHVARGGIVAAHGANFERVVWNGLLRRYDPSFPLLNAEQMTCTMARALAIGLPAGLDDIAAILKVDQRKDETGAALMKRMARPRSTMECPLCDDGCELCTAGTIYTWWDDPVRLGRLSEYCDQDVRTETAIDARLPPLSEAEREVWLWDQRLNDRGIQIDLDAVEKMQKVVDRAKHRLDRELTDITDGRVKRCSDAGALRAWITDQGIECASIAVEEQEGLIAAAKAAGLSNVVRAIEIRREAAKASTSKLAAMLHCVQEDGRVRGQLFYHGASSGRWAGRLIQPQNLYRIDPEEDGEGTSDTIQIVKETEKPDDALDLIEMLVGPPLVWAAKSMRQMFVGSEGTLLRGGDLSNIEGRLAAWVADEEWKLAAFRAYDAGLGPDLYKVAYAKSFGKGPEDVTSSERQVGKVQELALGYQGSTGALVKMSVDKKTGKNRLPQITATVRSVADAAVWDRMRRAYEVAPAMTRHGLDQDSWCACRIVTSSWRHANGRIMQSWWDVQDAAVAAMASPTEIVPVLNGRVRYLFNRGVLWCSLPSGRTIGYQEARLKTQKQYVYQSLDGQQKVAFDTQDQAHDHIAVQRGLLAFSHERTRHVVLYSGYEGEKKRWTTMSLYGGMQFNHIVQGTARDVIVAHGLEAERAGYAIVLTVHDELLSETPVEGPDAAMLERLMQDVPSFVGGLPLAAKAWEGVRYAK